MGIRALGVCLVVLTPSGVPANSLGRNSTWHLGALGDDEALYILDFVKTAEPQISITMCHTEYGIEIEKSKSLF